MDDVRAGRLLRALRHRARLTQRALGARVGVSQQEISLLERGHFDSVQLRTIRRVFRGLDAGAELDIRWRGGAIDRLLDERHAGLSGAMAVLLSDWGWQVKSEVTYNHFGDRGSIDLLAWHEPTATLLVVEVKTELTSIEATLRKHDEKVRLAPDVVEGRWGWRPATVCRVLVLPDQRTARRQVDRASATLTLTYPHRGREARRWIRSPTGPGDGLLFLPLTTRSGRSQRS